MAKLKQTNIKLPGQTQQKNFTNISAVDVCECLKTRHMDRDKFKYADELGCRVRKRRYKEKNLYKRNICNSIYIKNSTYQTATNTFTAVKFLPTISLELYGNLLQRLVCSLMWHITASTAISIFATLYYFIANTQGASAILDFKIAAAAPTETSTLSLIATHTFPTSTSSTSILLANLSSFPASHGYINNNISNSNSNSGSITFNHNNNSINNIYSNIWLDLNSSYSNINSTEITILNGVSFLPTNTISGYSHDNKNNIKDNYNNVVTASYNNAISINVTMDEMSDEDATEYIFDRTDVRIIFITLYTMVFCCCFFGNLLVILVVTLSRRLRSITNFFLANLALADFCVGLFCVMQNLSIYLIDSWVFGEFLCRMYQFVHSLSYTASIFILVVICMERYFAIVHPITCKQILTAARLRMVILTVWITSAVYSTPKFIFSKTIKNIHTESGREEEICVLDRKMFNSKLLDIINFGLLYIIPLLVMMVLYSKIAIALWRSSRGLQHHLAQQENGMGMHNSMYQHHHHQQHHNHNHNNQQQQQLTAPLGTSISTNSSVVSGSTLSRKQSCKYDAKRGVSISESQHDNSKVSLDADRPVVSTCRKTSFYKHSHNHLAHQQLSLPLPAPSNNHHHHHHHSRAHAHGVHGSQRVSHISHSSNNVLRARRGVVRMLIIFVLTFALCNLPYHARKMWQYWSRSYRGDSNFNALLTPLTFLVTYFNSGINPLLYAFLSRNFRKGMKELLMCSWRKSKTKSSINSSLHHKRMTLQTHSLPTDTTHIGNEQL